MDEPYLHLPVPTVPGAQETLQAILNATSTVGLDEPKLSSLRAITYDGNGRLVEQAQRVNVEVQRVQVQTGSSSSDNSKQARRQRQSQTQKGPSRYSDQVVLDPDVEERDVIRSSLHLEQPAAPVAQSADDDNRRPIINRDHAPRTRGFRGGSGGHARFPRVNDHVGRDQTSHRTNVARQGHAGTDTLVYEEGQDDGDLLLPEPSDLAEDANLHLSTETHLHQIEYPYLQQQVQQHAQHVYHPIVDFPVPPAPLPPSFRAIMIPLPERMDSDTIGGLDLSHDDGGPTSGGGPSGSREQDGQRDANRIERPSYIIPSRRDLSTLALEGPSPVMSGILDAISSEGLPPLPPQGWYCPSYPASFPVPLGEVYPVELLSDLPGWKSYTAEASIRTEKEVNASASGSGSTLDDPGRAAQHPTYASSNPRDLLTVTRAMGIPIQRPNFPVFPHVERMHASALPDWLDTRSREFAYFRHGDRKGKTRGVFAARNRKCRMAYCLLTETAARATGKKGGIISLDGQRTQSDDGEDGEEDDLDEDNAGVRGDLSTLATAAVDGGTITVNNEGEDPLTSLEQTNHLDRLGGTEGRPIDADAIRRSARNRGPSRKLISGSPAGPLLDTTSMYAGSMDGDKDQKRRVPHASYEEIIEWRCCWAGKRRVREVPSKTGKKRVRAPGIKVGCKARLVARSIAGTEDVDVTYHFYHEGHDPCDPEDLKKVRRGGLHPDIQAFLYGCDAIDIDAKDGESGTSPKRVKATKPKKPSVRKAKSAPSSQPREYDDIAPYQMDGATGQDAGGHVHSKRRRVEDRALDQPRAKSIGGAHGSAYAHSPVGFETRESDRSFEQGGEIADYDAEIRLPEGPWDDGSRDHEVIDQVDHTRGGSPSNLFGMNEGEQAYDSQAQTFDQSELQRGGTNPTARGTNEEEDQNAALVGLTNLARMPVNRMTSDVRSEIVPGGYAYEPGGQPQHPQGQETQQQHRGDSNAPLNSQHRSMYGDPPRHGESMAGASEHPNAISISSALHDLREASLVLSSLMQGPADRDAGRERGGSAPMFTACDSVKLEIVAKESSRLLRAAMDVGEEAKRKKTYEAQRVHGGRASRPNALGGA